MTQKEFLNAIIDLNPNEEIVNHAKSELKKIETQNEKRKNRKTPTQIENEKLIDEMISNVLSFDPIPANEIAKQLNISIPKASAIAQIAFKENRINCEEIRIPSSGIVKGYCWKA